MISMSSSQPAVARTERAVRTYSEPPAGWDDWVASTSGGSIYHLSGWRGVMEGVLGHEIRYAVLEDDEGGWRGGLPLVRVRSRLTGDHLLSMPFLNGGGPVGDEPARRALTRWAVREAGRLGVSGLELRCVAPVTDAAADPSDQKITVLLDLPSDAEELSASFHPKLRANVRRAEREGVELTFGAEQLPAFYEVFARNMRDLGTPVLPLAFFERIVAAFPARVLVAAAWWNGRPIGGQVSFLWGEELEMVWGSSLREFNNLKVTSLIHWEYMCRAIAAGCTIFNFGRCSPGSGTHQFKARWGGHDVPLPWLAWSSRSGRGLPSTDSPRYRMAVAAWKRLPLALTNRAGPLLARVLP